MAVGLEKTEQIRLAQLEEQVKKLQEYLDREPAIVVPIMTFAPEPFELTKEIDVVVQPQDDGYLASFFDANINAFGETQQDAVANLKDVMLILFEELASTPPEQLGPEPSRQLAILGAFIKQAEPCPK